MTVLLTVFTVIIITYFIWLFKFKIPAMVTKSFELSESVKEANENYNFDSSYNTTTKAIREDFKPIPCSIKYLKESN